MPVDPVVVRETATILEAHAIVHATSGIYCKCQVWDDEPLGSEAEHRKHVASVLAGRWEEEYEEVGTVYRRDDRRLAGTIRQWKAVEPGDALYRRVPQQPGDDS